MKTILVENYQCDFCNQVFNMKWECKLHEKEKHLCPHCEHSHYDDRCEFNCALKNDKKPCNSGGIFSSLAEGIAAYAKTIKGYDSGGNQESLVTNIYNTRSDEGCDFAGHGKPGTIEGMQSAIDTQYTGLGEYRYDPGNADIGGCYYRDQIYSQGYCSVKPSCTDYSNCSIATKTTVCEQNDYTAWRLKKQYSIRYDIFGL